MIAGLVVALLAPAAASAQTYPEPKDPGPVASKPKGPFETHTVCKKGCDFKSIQAAVNKAGAGDTVRVRNGVYREAVRISGAKKKYLKLIGNRNDPSKVLLRARGAMQNGVFVSAPTRSPSTASWPATTRPTGSSSSTSTATR